MLGRTRSRTDKTGKTEACSFCLGSGQCAKCNGQGLRRVPKGWLRRFKLAECIACEGSGRCPLCRGTGEAPALPAD